MNSPGNAALVLDAMGVIYSVGDDVADLLCPFIHENSGETDRLRIEALYREASLGRISASEFWHAVHLDPAREDEYLHRHRLSAGLLDFLRTPLQVSSIWCLSNDVSRWSRKLRERFGLTRFIHGFVVSGDVGARKPDPAIFHSLFAAMETDPGRTVLVDDRPSSLDAAKALGMDTILFAPNAAPRSARHRTASDFHELHQLILAI